MKTEAIVASAGIGKRLKSTPGVRKPYLKISGKPILIHTLQALSASSAIDSIIVAVHRLDKKRCEGLIKRYNIGKIKAVISGASERTGTVSKALALLDGDTDIVLIHDGVRPFIGRALIARAVECAKRSGACVVGVPVKAT
ncbi:MAG: 2-C-methyl-D-erythritol 4-phosphate cytidylyltransferase, partial [Candidatus Omnitrophica bacterium]|nr:2-C-methyl-D-erythritol 4-phosphate cytidylyltransferase [Candidatus Omnitrophota bacterium]